MNNSCYLFEWVLLTKEQMLSKQNMLMIIMVLCHKKKSTIHGERFQSMDDYSSLIKFVGTVFLNKVSNKSIEENLTRN